MSDTISITNTLREALRKIGKSQKELTNLTNQKLSPKDKPVKDALVSDWLRGAAIPSERKKPQFIALCMALGFTQQDAALMFDSAQQQRNTTRHIAGIHTSDSMLEEIKGYLEHFYEQKRLHPSVTLNIYCLGLNKPALGDSTAYQDFVVQNLKQGINYNSIWLLDETSLPDLQSYWQKIAGLAKRAADSGACPGKMRHYGINLQGAISDEHVISYYSALHNKAGMEMLPVLEYTASTGLRILKPDGATGKVSRDPLPCAVGDLRCLEAQNTLRDLCREITRVWVKGGGVVSYATFSEQIRGASYIVLSPKQVSWRLDAKPIETTYLWLKNGVSHDLESKLFSRFKSLYETVRALQIQDTQI